MIEIAKVSDDGFPIVDFKFQNRGQATAILHKFTVQVLSTRIDSTPILSHFLTISGESTAARFRSPLEGLLTLVTKNDGWGDALNSVIQLNNDTLAELFPPQMRLFRGIVGSSSEIPIITLNPATMDMNRFQHLLQTHKAKSAQAPKADAHQIDFLGRSRKEFADAIALEVPSVDVKCCDIDGNAHNNQTRASTSRLFGDFGSQLFLSPTKFIWLSHDMDIRCCMRMPTSRYFVSIDPERSATAKRYSISHSVASGQVERFQLALGAPKSCYVRLKFAFQVDGERVLESDEFEVHIWAPRDSRSHRGYYRYEDGDELLSLAAERAAKPQASLKKRQADEFEEKMKGWQLAEFLESGFPFLTKRDRDFD